MLRPAARCTFALVAVLAAPAAAAATITTLAEVDWENSAETASDPQGPATSGELRSEAIAGGGSAEAAIDVAGRAGLRVAGESAGGAVVSTLVSSADWFDTVTNTSGIGQHYQALISIPSISLFISDGLAHPTQRSRAYFDVSLEIDDVVLFAASALLRSGDNTAGATQAELLESGTDLGGTATVTGQRMRVDFAPFATTVDLGDFAASASFTMRYRLEIGMEIPGLEVSADASLGDPLSLQGSPLELQSAPSAVPLPAAGWLFVPALAGLAGRRRR